MEMYLEHHGILGQKWGIRRTPEQLGHKSNSEIDYKDKVFEAEEEKVIKNCSYAYSKFMEEPIDITAIVERSGLSQQSEIFDAANIGVKKYKEASYAESNITNDIIKVAKKHGIGMYGLEHRIKQPTSIAAKIGSDAKKKGIPFDKAADGIKDAVRYTTISNTKDYVNNYKYIKKSLEDAGYEEIKFKNYFEKYKKGESMHKSIQCVFKDPKGYEFEIQFHTPSSQSAKELKLPLYEERRKSGIGEKRAQYLESEMRHLAEKVADPPGIEELAEIRHSIFKRGDVMVTELYLEHHGIKGQKWGDKNGPPYPLDYSKLSSEEKAAAKGRAIRDGNIKEANANKAEFTDQEMTQLKNRFNLNEEVARLAIKDIKTGKQRIKEMTDVLGNVAELANKSLVLYNTAAKVYNGLNEDSSLPIFDGNNKKKKQNKN